MQSAPQKLVTTVFFVCSVPALLAAQTNRGPSTPEERARAIEVAKLLRVDPISPASTGNREWLMKWLIEIPDITVKMCSTFLGDTGEDEKGYRGALVASMMASQGSFLIEHPDRAQDTDGLYLAGVNGALDSYQAIQKKDENYRRPHLDELLKMREQRKLEKYVRTTAKTCKGRN